MPTQGDKYENIEGSTKANLLEAWASEKEEWREVFHAIKDCGKLEVAALAEQYDQKIGANFEKAKKRYARMIKFGEKHKDDETIANGLKTLEEDKKKVDAIEEEVEKHLADYKKGKEHQES
jgi:hypothetical protein